MSDVPQWKTVGGWLAPSRPTPLQHGAAEPVVWVRAERRQDLWIRYRSSPSIDVLADPVKPPVFMCRNALTDYPIALSYNALPEPQAWSRGAGKRWSRSFGKGAPPPGVALGSVRLPCCAGKRWSRSFGKGAPPPGVALASEGRDWPPSSSGLGHLVLSQKTGVRFPVGVFRTRGRNARVHAAAGASRRRAAAEDRDARRAVTGRSEIVEVA
jgi:hypothetical protein